MLRDECKIYDVVYLVKLNSNKTNFTVKKEINFRDIFGWVNNTILASGAMYATKDKIELVKSKVLKHLLKEAHDNLISVQKEYDALLKLSVL